MYPTGHSFHPRQSFSIFFWHRLNRNTKLLIKAFSQTLACLMFSKGNIFLKMMQPGSKGNFHIETAENSGWLLTKVFIKLLSNFDSNFPNDDIVHSRAHSGGPDVSRKTFPSQIRLILGFP